MATNQSKRSGPDHSQDGGTGRAAERKAACRWTWSGALFAAYVKMSCPYGAIHQDQDGRCLQIDEEKCFICGLCVSRCKRRALSMAQ